LCGAHDYWKDPFTNTLVQYKEISSSFVGSTLQVTVLRPRENQEEWCNVFVLHQNRVDRGPKNYIAEEMLPNFLDLVIWGHEHECKITPEWNDRCQFYVCQPGRYIAS
jgi:double-strand break repair protein MRE11